MLRWDPVLRDPVSRYRACLLVYPSGTTSISSGTWKRSMNESGEFAYPGGELELFAPARNWKAYWSSPLWPYLHRDVLEAGAGIGTNTRILRHNRQPRWVCLEPDRRLLEKLKSGLQRQPAQGLCEPFRGTVADSRLDCPPLPVRPKLLVLEVWGLGDLTMLRLPRRFPGKRMLDLTNRKWFQSRN